MIMIHKLSTRTNFFWKCVKQVQDFKHFKVHNFIFSALLYSNRLITQNYYCSSEMDTRVTDSVRKSNRKAVNVNIFCVMFPLNQKLCFVGVWRKILTWQYMQFYASSLWLPGVCSGGAGKNKDWRKVRKINLIFVVALKKRGTVISMFQNVFVVIWT